MPEQHGVMILFTRFTGGDRKFVHGRHAAVSRGNAFACELAAPKGHKTQARDGEILATPRDVNAKNIDFSFLETGKTGDLIEEMLEAAHVARSGVVLPAMNVNEEERAFRFMDHFERRSSLIIIKGRTLVSEL